MLPPEHSTIGGLLRDEAIATGCRGAAFGIVEGWRIGRFPPPHTAQAVCISDYFECTSIDACYSATHSPAGSIRVQGVGRR